MTADFKLLEKKEDERGFLIEFLKEHELGSKEKKFKQIYIATIAPGTVRANHYHKGKSEWITFINGKTHVVLENIKTKKMDEIVVDSSKSGPLIRVFIRPSMAHAFKNLSDSTVVLIAYTNKVYDIKNPDAFDYKVL